MGILPAPAVPLPPALFFLPWLIPFRPLSPPSPPPSLCGVGTERAQAAHRRPRRWVTGIPGPPSHTCSCWHGGSSPTHTDVQSSASQCIDFPTYRGTLGGGHANGNRHRRMCFDKKSPSASHSPPLSLPVSHRWLRAYLPPRLNMCCPPISAPDCKHICKKDPHQPSGVFIAPIAYTFTLQHRLHRDKLHYQSRRPLLRCHTELHATRQ